MSKYFKNFLFVLAALATLVGLSSCAAKKRISPLPSTFLEDADLKAKVENWPFSHSWVSAQAAKGDYKSVYYKPIRVDKLPSDAWALSQSQFISTPEAFLAEARLLGDYFHAQLVKQTQETKDPKFTLAAAPGSKTVVFEIVFTELEFSHPLVRTASLLSPIPGTGAAVSQVSDPHVAFAARVTDGETGKLLATVADRKFSPIRIVDFNKLTVTSSAREICAIWAESINAALQSEGLTKVKEKSFSLLPW